MSIPSYQILAKLAEAPRSAVFKAYHKKNPDRLLILKILKARSLSEAQKAQFLQRIEHLRILNDSLVITPISFEAKDEVFFMTQDFFPGVTLDKLIKERSRIPLNDFFEIACALARALDKVHQAGIIHGGVKPNNILVNPGTLEIRLIDFISTIDVRDVSHFIYDRSFVRGTLSYTSPEQTGRINHSVSFSSDLYSLGVVFYEMLTGLVPFASDDPLELIHSHLAEQAPEVHSLYPDVPAALGKVVAKLMLKQPEKRYQSGRGLLADLTRCRDEYRAIGTIREFPLEGSVHRVVFISRMVGRDKEAGIILEEYERSAAGSFRSLFLSGLPGIGKTRLVQELQRPMVKHRGYFTSGKFDLYQKNIPYSSLTQALRNLIRVFLTESDERVALWKNRILKALEKNGKVMTDVIPELEVLIGPQPEAKPLPPVESLQRFHDVFGRFLACLATKENPLILFIDDLQWCDAASFDFLADLFNNYRDHPYLFFLGAYRYNEVDSGHPLSILIRNSSEADHPLKEVRLEPLEPERCHEMVSYILDSPPVQTKALADYLSALTEGSPLFVSESLAYLYNEALLHLDRERQWRWDIDRIRESRMPTTVVALFGSKIRKFPLDLGTLLEYCACIGNTFSAAELSSIMEMPLQDVFETLRPALEQGLAIENRNKLQFIHDRIQEAVLSAIPAERRRRIHWQVGTRLHAAVAEGAADLDENLFAIVSHLNMGREENPDSQTAYFVSDLNYNAGNKALESLAVEAANRYFNVSLELLPNDCWDGHRYERTFNIFRKAAKTELMCGNSERSERLLERLLGHARTDLDRAECLAEQTVWLSSIGDFTRAIETANRGLAFFGKAIPDCSEEVERKRENLISEIGSRDIDIRQTFLNMPFTTDRKKKVESAFYSELLADLYFSRRVSEFYLVAAQATLHCMEGGMDEGIIYAFTAMGIYHAEQEEFEQSFLYEDLTHNLAAKYPNTFAATKCMNGATWTLMHTRNHPRDIVNYSLKAFQCGRNCGDINNAAIAYGPVMWNLQVQGGDLPAIEDYARECLQFASRYHVPLAMHLAEATQAGWVAPMKKDYSPIPMEEKLKQWEQDDHAASLCSYYVHKAVSHYYFGEYEEVETELASAEKHLLSNNVLKREWHVFKVLNTLRLYERGSKVDNLERGTLNGGRANEVQGSGFKGSKVKALNGEPGAAPSVGAACSLDLAMSPATNLRDPTKAAPTVPARFANERELMAEIRPLIRKIEKWASFGPLFKPYLAFIHAELARVTGVQYAVQGSGFRGSEVKTLNGEPRTFEPLNDERFREARSLYLDAIDIAHEQKYTFLEGHLNECLGELLRQAGQCSEGIYFSEAARLYKKCSAERKEIELLEKYPEYFEEISTATATTTTAAATAGLPDFDIAYLMKSSLTISAEIDLKTLLKKIMNVVIESSGAQHGYLLIEEEGSLLVRAESHVTGKQAGNILTQKLDDAGDICKAIVRYVHRTGERVILNDAAEEGVFKDNPEVQDMQLRSVLCLPVIKQSRTIGILYLENRLSDSVFTSERSQMTELLTSQAAISLENAALFDERRKAEEALKKSEQHYATTLASIGDAVIAADMTGSITFMNAVAEELTGWTLKDTLSKPSEAVFRIINERTRKEVASPIKQVLDKGAIVGLANHTILVRKDGKEVPIDDSGAPIKDAAGKIIGIVLVFRDTTARRQAEREHERLSAIVESTDDAIIGKVLDGTVTSWNKAAEKMYGFTAVEMLGKSVLRIIPADRREEYSRILGQLSRGKKIAHHDTVRVRKDGARFDVSVTVAPIKNHYGEIIGASTIARDITERKKAEEALRTSLKREQFLANLVRNASVAMVIGYADGRLGMHNLAFQKLTGYSEEELSSITWNTALTPPEWREYEAKKLSELHLSQLPVHYEKEYVRKNGSRVPIELAVHPFFDDAGKISQYFAFMSDITERKANEERIKTSLREKEALLKEIHHRVKNNLQIIYSMLNLQLPQIKDEKAIELFRESQNRVHSMALIHEKLYQSESLARVDLAKYVRSLTANLFLSYGVSERIVKPRIAVENISLDIDTVIPCALIINELVSNSLKHAFPGLKRVQVSKVRGSGPRDSDAERGTVNGEPFVQGEIRIEMKRGSEVQSSKVSGSEFKGSKVKDSNPEPGTLNGERVIVLTVSDNGVGLPKGIQVQRCQSLGLKLVSVLVKQIKGAIHVGEREGTEFVITFEVKK